VPDHRRVQHEGPHHFEMQATLQIYLPIAGGFLLTLAVLLWVALRSHSSLASLSNLSVALLSLPLLFFGLLALALVSALLVAVGWLLGNVPYYAGMLQKWAQRGAGIILQGADWVAAPLILAKSAAEYVGGPLRALKRSLQSREDD